MLLALTVLSTSLYAREESLSGKIDIIFTDNSSVTGGPNDMGETGDLTLTYTDPENRYKLSAKGELYVNTMPGDTNVTRTNPNNLRIDVLSFSFIQGGAFKYGLGFELLGDFGGDHIQNSIHDLTHNPHIPAQYVSGTHSTLTVNFEYRTKLFNDAFDLLATGKIPLIMQNGIAELNAMMTYTSHYTVYHQNIDAAIGLGLECTHYPDLPVFKGYPTADYQACTPQTRLSAHYEAFEVFWEIPLMNNDVENSVLGIRYRF